MLRPKPTMISLSMKDVTEHLESAERKAAKARAEGIVNSSSMRQPLGALRNDRTSPPVADEPRVIYLNEINSHAQGITPVPISTDMLHSFDLTIRSIESAEFVDQTAGERTLELAPRGNTENTATTTNSEDDSVSLGFLESDGEDEDPDFLDEQDSTMTEVPGGSPIPRVPRPSMDYSSFEGSSRDSSSFGTLSPNITIRKPRSRPRLIEEVPEDASTPPGPASEVPQNSQVQRLRARHPLPRSPLFNSTDGATTPMRAGTIGLAPRLTSPGTPNTLFSQPPRSTRTYRQREMTYSYEESENPNAGETQVYEDETAHPDPDDEDYWDEEYYDEHGEYYDIDEEEEDEEEEDQVEGEPNNQEAIVAEQQRATFPQRTDSLGYRQRSPHHERSIDDTEEALPSSPPVYVAGAADGNYSRNSRTLMPSVHSTAVESVRPGLTSSPSLQLPPPFSASPRRVSDNAALPALPPMMPSSDDDRGRGRTRFPFLGGNGHPSSLEAQASNSPASPASEHGQHDGSPESVGTARSIRIRTLPVRLLRPDTTTIRAPSPISSWESRVAGVFPGPIRFADAAAFPSPAPPHASPSTNGLPGHTRSPRRQPPIRPDGLPFNLAPHEMMSSSTDGDEGGSTPVQVWPRPPRTLNSPPAPVGTRTPVPVTTPGTSRPHRMPRVHTTGRPLPTLPMRIEPLTPGGRVRVYDDRASPAGQPQTPDDLPESMHRGRFHPAFTAPIPQDNEPRDYTNGGRDYTRSEMRTRRGPGRGPRSDSPLGARGGGMEGLYGGRENGEERELYQRGQEFARRRLFVGDLEGRRAETLRRFSGRWGNVYTWEGDSGRVERLEGGVERGERR